MSAYQEQQSARGRNRHLGGERRIDTLHDGSGPESISIDEATNVAWVQLIIQSVYRGAKYRDT
jgi:hypothetical protein